MCRTQRNTPIAINGAAIISNGAAASRVLKNSHDGSQNPQYIDARLPSVPALMNARSPSSGLRR